MQKLANVKTYNAKASKRPTSKQNKNPVTIPPTAKTSNTNIPSVKTSKARTSNQN